MTRHDWELLDKQLWTATSPPRQSTTTIGLMIVAVFLVGIGIGDILSKSKASQYKLRCCDFQNSGSTTMIRTTIVSVTASFVLFGAWAVNLVTYHPATDLNPLAPLNAPVDWK